VALTRFCFPSPPTYEAALIPRILTCITWPLRGGAPSRRAGKAKRSFTGQVWVSLLKSLRRSRVLNVTASMSYKGKAQLWLPRTF